MSASQPLIVDFAQPEDVMQLLPHPAQRSSEALDWSGIYVQQHYQPGWETPEHSYTSHMLLVHGATQMMRAERWFDGRRREEQLGYANNIVLVPAAIAHRANWAEESPFSLLFLEPSYLAQVAREVVVVENIELIPQHAMPDPLIEQIGRSLVAELEANSLGSRLFVDSLTTALAIHLLRRYANLQRPLQNYAGGLAPRQLQQAIDYINAHLAEDLTVTAIAAELGLSQYYFSRMFKRSLGSSPYQYVTQKRIEHVIFLLRTTSLSVAEIASQVGFANQNQLTIQFRKLMNTTPSDYRKNL